MLIVKIIAVQMGNDLVRNSSRIDALDYARFAAAMAVMLFHYSYGGVAYGGTPHISYIPALATIGKYGYFGVELFFMISGFVIFISLKGRSASQFAVARALRLYPAFLICLLITTLATLVWGEHLNKINLVQVAANLTMFPALFGQKNIDGSYWSLIIELKFYAFIFCIILFGFVQHIEKFFFIWPVIMLAASLIGFEPFLNLSGYCCYFSAGVLFAMRRERKSVRLNLLLLVCFFFSIQLSAFKNLEVRDVNPLSQLVVLLIVFSFYAYFWFLGNDKILRIRLPFAQQLGQITYPLYLIHQTIGYIIINHFANEQNKLYIILSLLIAMPLAGVALHYVAEDGLRNFWRAVFSSLIGTPVRYLETYLANIDAKRIFIDEKFSFWFRRF